MDCDTGSDEHNSTASYSLQSPSYKNLLLQNKGSLASLGTRGDRTSSIAEGQVLSSCRSGKARD